MKQIKVELNLHNDLRNLKYLVEMNPSTWKSEIREVQIKEVTFKEISYNGIRLSEINCRYLDLENKSLEFYPLISHIPKEVWNENKKDFSLNDFLILQSINTHANRTKTSFFEALEDAQAHVTNLNSICEFKPEVCFNPFKMFKRIRNAIKLRSFTRKLIALEKRNRED